MEHSTRPVPSQKDPTQQLPTAVCGAKQLPTAACVGDPTQQPMAAASEELSVSPAQLPTRDIREQFLVAVSKSPYLTNTANNGTDDKDSSCLEERQQKCLILDLKAFLHRKQLSGRGGYSDNIDQTSVTNDDGTLTGVGEAAYCMWRASHQCQGERNAVITIVPQRLNFLAQQAMTVLEVVHDESVTTSSRRIDAQHIVQVRGVQCITGGQAVMKCTLDELLTVRYKQMTDAYIIKYGSRYESSQQLDSMAQRIAEAVVKFELLSVDPKSMVKISLGSGGDVDVDTRFSGAFVLYNYARLSSLLARYQRACEKGEYPNIPTVEEVDFSLLRDQEEWELMFHYVLNYPLLLEEAAELTIGTVIHSTINVKKVCQFLVQLSRKFSSYYSRVKILVSPEPHLLGVVHARVRLLSAIRQVMQNALSLLCIEPLAQM